MVVGTSASEQLPNAAPGLHGTPPRLRGWNAKRTLLGDSYQPSRYCGVSSPSRVCLVFIQLSPLSQVPASGAPPNSCGMGKGDTAPIHVDVSTSSIFECVVFRHCCDHDLGYLPSWRSQPTALRCKVTAKALQSAAEAKP